MRDWLRIAHRGASALEPENTLAAFRRAVEIGVDGVEMDVHLTVDGEVVVIHDDTLDRTTDLEGEVSKLLLEAIQEADAGKGERVPTLREALEVIPEDVLAFIEIKDEAATLPTVYLLQQMGRLDQAVVISFQSAILQAVRGTDTRIPTGLLIGKALVPDDPAANGLAMLRAAQVTGTSVVSMHWELALPETVWEIRRRGGTVWTWTVNDVDRIRHLASIGVTAITSDDPNLLNEASK